jgi:ketosteroid isomerase-like protein
MCAKIAILMLCLCAANAAVAQSKSADSDAIRASRHASNEALRLHDLKAFSASLDPELVVVTGRGAFLPTRQAYLDSIAQGFANPEGLRFERLVDSIDVNPDAPLAAEHGHWVGIAPNGAHVVGGTYLAMWRRSKAGWKIRSELFVLLNCFDQAACERYRHP